MRLPEGHLNTTAFLCIEEMTRGGVQYIPTATAFFVMDRSLDPPHPLWVVTARHCIQEMRASGKRCALRVNTDDSFIDIETRPDDWHESDEHDVAVAYWNGPSECVITAVPFDQFVGDDYSYDGGNDLPAMREAGGQDVRVGHEVFFVGLFNQHWGREKNLPIARYGAVSRLPHEKIVVQRKQGRERILGYLVEARSVGGHSGSPAFWLYPTTELREIQPPPRPGVNREQRRKQPPARPLHVPVPDTAVIALLGLVSAHFDIDRALAIDPESTEEPEELEAEEAVARATGKINAGIAVVTPASAISELLDSPAVIAERDEFREQATEDLPAATYDVAQQDEVVSEEFGR